MGSRELIRLGMRTTSGVVRRQLWLVKWTRGARKLKGRLLGIPLYNHKCLHEVI